MFTTTVFDASNEDDYLNKLPESMDNYTEEINYLEVGFKFKLNDSIFENIDAVNEIVQRI